MIPHRRHLRALAQHQVLQEIYSFSNSNFQTYYKFTFVIKYQLPVTLILTACNITMCHEVECLNPLHLLPWPLLRFVQNCRENSGVGRGPIYCASTMLKLQHPNLNFKRWPINPLILPYIVQREWAPQCLLWSACFRLCQNFYLHATALCNTATTTHSCWINVNYSNGCSTVQRWGI